MAASLRQPGAHPAFIVPPMQTLMRNRAAAAGLFLAAAAFSLPATPADAADIYTVGGIAVDETGADGGAAREAALRAGERIAFGRLLQWLLLERDVSRVPDEQRADPSPYVIGYSVQDERISTNRYRGTLEIRFDPDRVRGLMQELGLDFAEQRPAAHLVIPVLRRGGRTTLWDDNPWLDAWASRDRSADFIPLRVPHGEASDVALLSAADAVAGNPARIADLGRHYGLPLALIAEASQQRPGARVDVVTRLTEHGQTLAGPLRLQLTRTADETEAELLQRAAMTTARAAGDLWAQSERRRKQAAETVEVRALFDSFHTWRRLRSTLEQSSLIADTAIRRLTPQSADLVLAYSGVPDVLRDALVAAGLEIDSERTPWTLRMPAEPESAAAPEPAADPSAPAAPPSPPPPLVD